MYEDPGNNSNNGKMAIEKNQFIKYKLISGRLKEHFGFKLLAEGNIKNADVYYIHCDKSFAYHGSNTSLTYHLQKKHLLQYSKVQPTKSALFGQFTTAASSTSKQTTLIRNWHSLPRLYFAYWLPQFRVNNYFVLLVTLLTKRVHHLNQILLISLFVCVAGYLTIFERKNAHFISGY